MGKGRKPCCDKAGVKRGPWSQAEDLKLISFIQKHGHSNWRALPKLAGLARCGKSCRLRWVNYLRPDLKRGNFTPQEEESIIKLHEILGNKWSKIASHFPGRTDNEIKNVWNTHLKKRIKVKDTSDDFITPKINCSQVLSQQTTLMNEMVENTSYSSSSYSVQMSDSNSQVDQGVPSPHAVEQEQNVGDKGGTSSVEVNKVKEDLLEELIEIPFEPNLELWDLLDGDSNSNDTCDYFGIDEIETPQLNPTFESDKMDCMESDRSWWWMMYLENELGLNQSEGTSLQATSVSNGGLLLDYEKGGYFANITTI